MSILTVNAGSSSLKFSLHPIVSHQASESILTGNIDGLEPQGSPVLTFTHEGITQSNALPVQNNDPFASALHRLQALLSTIPGIPPMKVIAHRVVHGGQHFSKSTVVTESILTQLQSLNALAPLHQPNNLAGLQAFTKAFPELTQVACFDTAFHTTMDPVDYSFALPKSITDQGIRRYGFHGLSYQYVMRTLQQHSPRASGRVVMAHIGNGASLCGALNGQSVATTMGFSALDGLMMGTRCGKLDAGVLLYLMEQGWDHASIQSLLYKQSGLLGVSGISADMRKLRSDKSASAEKAIALFTQNMVRETGSLVAILGGLDVLTFSGGIGEHDVLLRTTVCNRLSWMGLRMNSDLNASATGDATVAIHHPDSTIEVWVIPTNEGIEMARSAVELLPT